MKVGKPRKTRVTTVGELRGVLRNRLNNGVIGFANEDDEIMPMWVETVEDCKDQNGNVIEALVITSGECVKFIEWCDRD